MPLCGILLRVFAKMILELTDPRLCTFDVLDYICSNEPEYICMSSDCAIKYVGLMIEHGARDYVETLIEGKFGLTIGYANTPMYVEHNPITNVNSLYAKYYRRYVAP